MTTPKTIEPATAETAPAITAETATAETAETSAANGETAEAVFLDIPRSFWNVRLAEAFEADQRAKAAAIKADEAGARARAADKRLEEAINAARELRIDADIAAAKVREAIARRDNATSRAARKDAEADIDAAQSEAFDALVAADKAAERAAVARRDHQVEHVAHGSAVLDATHAKTIADRLADGCLKDAVPAIKAEMARAEQRKQDADECARILAAREAVTFTRCKDCAAWTPWPGTPREGRCRRHPPTPDGTPSKADDFCLDAVPLPTA